MIDDAAVELLAIRLRTPLQIEQHLVLAFEEALRVDVKPVTVEVVESVLSRHMDDLEPRLVRHGYDARAVAELIGAKPGEVRLLLQGRLEASRARGMDRADDGGRPAGLIRLTLYGQRWTISRPSQSSVG